jgi:hypothetical protein
MARETDIETLKQRLSPRIMDIDGVSGVGAGEHHLHVYLERDDESIRNAVENAVRSEAPELPIRYISSGKFTAL